MGLDAIWFYVILVSIGGVLGWWLFNNHKNNTSHKNAKIPVIGGMLAYDMWWPRTAVDYDRIIEKAYVCIIFYLALNVSWLFWSFLGFAILYRPNFISER